MFSRIKNCSLLIKNLERTLVKNFSTNKNLLCEKSDKNNPNIFGQVSVNSGYNRIIAEDKFPDDDDNYDQLEIKRDRRSKWFFKYALTNIVYKTPHRIHEALKLFDEMRKYDRRPVKNYHYTMLITGSAKVGYTEKAFELFEQMLQYKFRPQNSAITSLFNACAECPMPEYGLEKANYLRRWVFENGLVCNRKNYHSMIKAFAKLGDMKSAFELLKEMVEKKYTTNTETYNQLLIGCVSNRKTGLLDCIRIIRKMREFNLNLDIFSYNLLLRTVRDCEIGDENDIKKFLTNWTTESKAKRLENFASQSTLSLDKEKVEEKLPFKLQFKNELMKLDENGINLPLLPNFLTASSLSLTGQVIGIDVESLKEPCNRLQLIGGVNGILDLMNSDEVQPNIKTLSLLVNNLTQTNEAENDLILLLDNYKIKPDADFFNMIIKRRCMRNDISSAKLMLRTMQAYNKPPNIMTFGVLATGCKNATFGLQLLEDIDKSGFQANIEIFGALLSNACCNQDFHYILSLLKSMEEKQIKPDAKLIEKIIFTEKFVHEILCKLENNKYDNEILKKSKKFSTEKYREQYREFKLYFKAWLRRNKLEIKPHVWDQYNHDISKSNRESINQFETEMKQLLKERREKDLSL